MLNHKKKLHIVNSDIFIKQDGLLGNELFRLGLVFVSYGESCLHIRDLKIPFLNENMIRLPPLSRGIINFRAKNKITNEWIKSRKRDGLLKVTKDYPNQFFIKSDKLRALIEYNTESFSLIKEVILQAL